jgi:hypothetical protein
MIRRQDKTKLNIRHESECKAGDFCFLNEAKPLSPTLAATISHKTNTRQRYFKFRLANTASSGAQTALIERFQAKWIPLCRSCKRDK